MNNPVRSAGH